MFEGPKRSFDISLANSGKDSATYVISFIQIRMTENGAFETVETPDQGQRFADTFLRIFPRQVTLAPNEAQTVKVQTRRINEMKEGEYRSHLYFRAVPKEPPLGESNTKGDSSIAVRITPIYGISIPVIIKVGKSDTQVELTHVSLNLDQEHGPVTTISFQRMGNMSVYGDIIVNHISAQGKMTKVGAAKGFAVYTPNAVRKFDLALDKTLPVDYKAGKLQVLYTDQASTSVVLAQKEISLQ
ncbi:MAG: molecular chaperone [Bacteroidota bacterium]|nr:molecular chaperone [Bacteroidota bacterium]